MEDGPQKEELTVPDGLLTNLERDFNEVMRVLDHDGSLNHFRLEYEKLYRALRKSHESEKQLVRRCQELTQELLSNAAKMQAAVKLSQGDHSTIEALKQEIEKAWRAVDSANDKDLRARETVKTLKEEVNSLQTMLQEGTVLPPDHAATMEEIKLENKRLQLEGEDMTKQVETLTREIADMTHAERKAATELEDDTVEVKRVVDRLELLKQEHRRERNARERAEFQCRELLLQLRAREAEMHMGESREGALQESIAALRSQMSEAQEKKQALLQKIDTVDKQLFHTQQSYNDSIDTTTDLNERLQEIDGHIARCERDIAAAEDESARLLRVKDSDFKELARLRQQNENIAQQEENLLRQIDSIQRHLQSLRLEKKNLDDALGLVALERSALARQGESEVQRRAAIEKVIAQEAEHQKELEEAISREREIRLRLLATVQRLEKDREKCIAEVSQVGVQHQSAMAELKMATTALEDTQKKIDESEANLTRQQARYEQVRAERNQFSKKLIEAQDEIVELRQKFKMMDHQILQFKEELHLKNRKYQDEVARQKAAKERLMKARKMVNECTATFDEVRREGESMSQNIRQLVKVIHLCDKELSGQQQEFLKISKERDLLGAQLIRRNDELALLYEKLRIQQETLGRGEEAYRARVDDMRLLRLKMAEVRRQVVLATVRARDLPEMKERLHRLEQDITTAQANAAALSEELENPQNAARWRKIEGDDPTPEELQAKIAQLQKRLISKSEESLEHELTLQEKDRLITELQALLARQPGPQVAQQLNLYQKDLQKKNVSMKVKASELNMTSTRIAELKYEAERLRRELHEMKRKYYEMKMLNDTMLNAPYTQQLQQNCRDTGATT